MLKESGAQLDGLYYLADSSEHLQTFEKLLALFAEDGYHLETVLSYPAQAHEWLHRRWLGKKQDKATRARQLVRLTGHLHQRVVEQFAVVQIEPTHKTIDLERLERQEPIGLYVQITLYEDELADHGSAQMSVKLRAMPDFFFLSMRFYLRIHRMIVRWVGKCEVKKQKSRRTIETAESVYRTNPAYSDFNHEMKQTLDATLTQISSRRCATKHIDPVESYPTITFKPIFWKFPHVRTNTTPVSSEPKKYVIRTRLQVPQNLLRKKSDQSRSEAIRNKPSEVLPLAKQCGILSSRLSENLKRGGPTSVQSVAKTEGNLHYTRGCWFDRASTVYQAHRLLSSQTPTVQC
ncbi:hypothetical protein KIN20_010280 [Parelaphostrongylus tenuis]|uniref:TIP41-like protein n=1 Tax=Parelaphostrongylus tenuis TaxID=148309 RepID=A0AAD5MB64_PARTN|nr:hypothetical protein KIN20_010280 [Parelaphostrongylus tenuis]